MTKQTNQPEQDFIKVSDHAIVRYIQRIIGINLNDIKKEILSKEIINHVKILGKDGIYNNNGFNVVIRDNVVVTIHKNRRV